MGLTFSRTARYLLLAGLATAYLVVFPLLCRDSKYVLGVVTNASVLSFISLGVWVTFAS